VLAIKIKPKIMGFNKRILKKENILNNLLNLFNYLNADAIICTDDFSRKVYRMYEEGFTKEEIINVINKMKTNNG
jgi:hypothetical protein